jgi:hypothetical protein
MKIIFTMLFLTVFLCGCPDTKVPKAPPLAPQPKAVANTLSGPVLAAADSCDALSPARS